MHAGSSSQASGTADGKVQKAEIGRPSQHLSSLPAFAFSSGEQGLLHQLPRHERAGLKRMRTTTHPSRCLAHPPNKLDPFAHSFSTQKYPCSSIFLSWPRPKRGGSFSQPFLLEHKILLSPPRRSYSLYLDPVWVMNIVILSYFL